jgi:hypothetical protein
MKKSIGWMSSVLLTAGLALSGTGCTVYGRSSGTVHTAPPPPRYVVRDTRPGYVWVDGYWDMVGGHWVWRDGYWERERPGYVYIQGRWDSGGNNNGYRYRHGRWERRDDRRVYRR